MSKDFNLEKVLDAWPRYKKHQGWELIDIDFENSHPESAGNLKHLWHKYVPKIINLAYEEAEGKTKKDKDAMLKYSQKPPTPDEENNFLGCLALHALYYLCPKKNKTTSQILSKMFSRVENTTKIDDEVRKISERAAIEGEQAMNPFILYFDDKHGVPYKFFVCVDQLVYELATFVTALDILFKSYFVLNLNYPPEAKNVLMLIQHFFFKIYLPNDGFYTTVLAVMCDIDIDRGLECEALMTNVSHRVEKK